MKYINAILLSALILPSISQAAIFDFSYLFQEGYGDNRGIEPTLVKGYLSGDKDGDYVKNISNIHMSIQGRPFSNNLTSILYAPGIGNPWVYNQEGLVSFDASLNNFMFFDGTYAAQGTQTNYFIFINHPGTGLIYRAASNDISGYSYGFDRDSQVNTSWSLVERVPEPSTLILIISGLMFAGIRRFTRPRS